MRIIRPIKGTLVRFKTGKPQYTIKIINFKTPVRLITFYIIPSNILFLIYIKDIDNLIIYLNNIKNKLIKHFLGHK